MNLIDGNTAQHGLTIVADSQTGGKGQRGKTWADEPGQSLLMSIILVPRYELAHQFMFNASVAVAVSTQPGRILKGIRTEKLVEQAVPNVRLVCPKNNCPSPYPVASPLVLAKNSIEYTLPAALSNDPLISVPRELDTELERMG